MKAGFRAWKFVMALLASGVLLGTMPVKASEDMDGLTVNQTSEDKDRAADADDLPGEGENWIEISDMAGLLGMEADPEGAYVLTADIDATGVEWYPFSFHGKLNGNGHSILNLTILDAGEAIRETFDGNMKVYDTYFSGFFDELDGAWVSDLHLVNERISVETDQPCFIGGIAGYMENSVIENCSVQGILELRAHDRMFGVGGMIGYGCGTIQGTAANVTLVCIDTDAATKDEQFMGGVCAAGYPDIHDCTVQISGFDSDHGYVHDGGLVGMYMFYPKGTKYKGSITDNMVTGKITFFEDNKNRRAYCTGFIGEIMNWDFENGRNKNDFVRDEVFQYDVDLVPHACDAPVMREEVTPAGCEFGYSTYVCETCGYAETDQYTLKNHAYEWAVLREPSEEEEGLRQGICKDCGASTEEILPKVIPVRADNETEAVDGEGGNGEGRDGENGDGQGNAENSLDVAGDMAGKDSNVSGGDQDGMGAGESGEADSKIWTVPKVGKLGTLAIAVLVALGTFGITWIAGRQKR